MVVALGVLASIQSNAVVQLIVSNESLGAAVRHDRQVYALPACHRSVQLPVHVYAEYQGEELPPRS